MVDLKSMYTDFEVIQAWEFPWSDVGVDMDQTLNSLQRNDADAGHHLWFGWL
jgi:hypothetical protein